MRVGRAEPSLAGADASRAIPHQLRKQQDLAFAVQFV
jgi:hypothetical protein